MIPSNTTYWTFDLEQNEVALCKEKLSLFTNNLLYIKSPGRNGHELLMRGVSKDYLKAIFENGEDGSCQTNILLSRLFYYGDKAKYFFNNIKNDNLGPAIESLADRSSSAARKIFDRLGQLTLSKTPQIQKFVRNNEKFFAYFKNPENQSPFSELIKSDSGALRDYYLCILHRAGHECIGPGSIGVSASTSFKTVSTFSNEFVIYFIGRGRFLGKQLGCQTAAFPEHAPILESKDDIYPDEQESTVFGAILAHNILGVLDQQTSKFYANPHLFSEKNRNLYIADYPLEIDQSNFDELVQSETNYYGYIFTSDHEHYGEERLRTQ